MTFKSRFTIRCFEFASEILSSLCEHCRPFCITRFCSVGPFVSYFVMTHFVWRVEGGSESKWSLHLTIWREETSIFLSVVKPEWFRYAFVIWRGNSKQRGPFPPFSINRYLFSLEASYLCSLRSIDDFYFSLCFSELKIIRPTGYWAEKEGIVYNKRTFPNPNISLCCKVLHLGLFRYLH